MDIAKRSGLFIALLLMISLSARAASPSASPLNSRLTIQVNDAPLDQVLETVAAQTKASFILADGAGSHRVSADAKDTKASDILRKLLDSKGLTYRRIGKSDSYVVISKSQAALTKSQDAFLRNNRALDSRLTIAVNDAPLKDILETITAQTKVNFTLGAGLDSIRATINLKDLTAREVLEVVLELKELEILQSGMNDFTIMPNPRRNDNRDRAAVVEPAPAAAPPTPVAPAPSPAPAAAPISLTCRDEAGEFQLTLDAAAGTVVMLGETVQATYTDESVRWNVTREYPRNVQMFYELSRFTGGLSVSWTGGASKMDCAVANKKF